jgi:hypothetical protein
MKIFFLTKNHFSHLVKTKLLLALIGFSFLIPRPGLAQNQETIQATLQLEVWRLVSQEQERADIGWEPFKTAGQEPGRVDPNSFAGQDPSSQKVSDARKTSEGLVEKSFLLLRQGEEWLGPGEIEKRMDAFTKILRDGFDLTEGPQAGSGRRYYVKREPARVIVVDEGMNVVRMQLVYESIFPVALVQRRAAASPAPPRPPAIPDTSLVIQTLKAQHRSSGELEEALEVISGIRRPEGQQHLAETRQDPMKMKVNSDAPSGSLIVTSPDNRTTTTRSAPPPAPARRPATADRYQDARVSLERSSVSSKNRYLRLGQVDKDLLRSKLEQYGRVEAHKRQAFRLVDGKPLTIEGGRSIPFIRYRPYDEDKMNRGAKIGLTIHVMPVANPSGEWKLTLLTEKVDFANYPKLEKIFTDYTTFLQPGDTLIARRWSDREIADLSGFHPEKDQPAETILLLTLR